MRQTLFFLIFVSTLGTRLGAATGRESASFLDIPVGAEPAALGSAYTALADNAYATVWNPAGLARLDVVEVAGTHLSYLQSINYEYLSGALPFHKGERPNGFGFSVQSLNSGDIDQRDEAGNGLGAFTTSFDAYALGFGQAIGENSSFGIMTKVISEKIASTSATGYALDLGWLYDARKTLTFGAAISNLGTAIKFVNQTDPLPLQARGGVAWRFTPDFRLSSDLIYRRDGPAAGALGLEWSNSAYYALRAGYNSSHIKDLSVGSGFTAGFALHYFGQEFAYAWVPFGALGNTHYFSLLIRFSTQPRADRAYPDLPKVRLRHAKQEDDDSFGDRAEPAAGYHDYNNIEDVLSEDERRSLKKFNKKRTDDFDEN